MFLLRNSSQQITFKIIHIWQYEGGYAALDEAASKTADLDSYNKYRAERAQMLKQRTNQLLVQFNYMPDPIPRDGKNIYELRSYKLRSGRSTFTEKFVFDLFI